MLDKNSTEINSDSYCPPLHLDVWYILLTITFFLVCLWSIIISVVLYVVVPKVDLFHANVKFYLRNLTICIIIAAFGMQLRAAYSSVGWIFGFDKLQMNDLTCKVLLTPYTFACNCLTLFVVCIGVDRYVAIKKALQIEDDQPTRGAKISVYSVWIISLIFEITYFADSVSTSVGVKCFCSTSWTLQLEIQISVLVVLLFLQIGVVFLFWFVYRKNKILYENFNLTTSSHNLHERFHLSSNMKATAMLIPYLIVHVVMGFVSNGAHILLTHIWTEGHLDNSAVNVIVLISSFCVVDLLIAPILWIRHHESLNKIALANFPKLKLFFVASNDKVDTVNADGCKKTASATATAKKVKASVNFRVKPEKADEILQNIWATRLPPVATRK